MRDSGESLFERLCTDAGLACERVEEAAKESEQRPDFRVIGRDGTSLWVEVKTVTPSEEEAEQIRRIHAREVVVRGGTPGDRLRRFIGKANSQLKALAKAGLPGVLAVVNDEPLLRWHVDPYSVLTAMRGLDVVDVLVPHDPGVPPEFGDVRSGPGKQMTPVANTSTSAIVCVETWRGGETAANVFHNCYAAVPLPPTALSGAPFKQWRIADNERDWIPLAAG